MGDFAKEAYEGHREQYPECYPPEVKVKTSWRERILLAFLIVAMCDATAAILWLLVVALHWAWRLLG